MPKDSFRVPYLMTLFVMTMQLVLAFLLSKTIAAQDCIDENDRGERLHRFLDAYPIDFLQVALLNENHFVGRLDKRSLGNSLNKQE